MVAAPALEAGLLRWQHFTSAVNLAPQVVAPAPYDVFHDLRWLWIYHPSWVVFGGELAPVVFLSLFMSRGGVVRDWWRGCR